MAHMRIGTGHVVRGGVPPAAVRGGRRVRLLRQCAQHAAPLRVLPTRRTLGTSTVPALFVMNTSISYLLSTSSVMRHETPLFI